MKHLNYNIHALGKYNFLIPLWRRKTEVNWISRIT